MSAAPQRAAVPGLAEVYRDHMEFVWRTCRYLGVPAADAEDVVHDVFIVVKRRLAQYDRAYSMRGWLAGITRNEVLHHHRGRARSERKIAAAPARVDDEPGPEQAVSRGEAAALLREFLDGLDARKREAFVLCELEGLSVVEIAPVLGANVNTIHSRLRSARQAFERHVARLETVRRRESG